ncbi:Low-temperature-induced 65 kDa protein [Glycine soja]|uniref:Low-temperature-induced 65 kDa protein n=1 Tax=Glycine soja TaxID=3848 RepID=A0A0B2SE14_GLYSO|nr:Low-temperature-induced 65 kDa protein [Glycine soja]
MDSRAVQTHSHEHHHNSHNVGSHAVAHGEEQHHHDHEKKSVLKKVKQKAKKIKDTITKHGHHDHEHEHGHEYHLDDQHIPDDHDLEEEDEMDEYPEVHGAPIYDSAAVRGAAPGHANTLGRPGVNFGGTTVMGVEPLHELRVVVVSPTTEINQNRTTDPTRTFVEGEKAVHRKVNLERPMYLEEDPHAPRSTSQAYAPANYQTKVTDPTGAGGAEIDITPVEKSFSRMAVHNEPKPYPEPKLFSTVPETHYPSAGSHSQLAPELSSATNYPTNYPSAQSYAKNTVASKLGYGNNTETKTTQTTQTRNQLKNTGNEKPSTISSATSAIADKAVSAKNTVASKLGFGDTATTTQQEKRTDHAAAPTEYGKSVAQSLREKLAPVSGKDAGVGSGVKSKVSGTQTSSVGVEQDKGVSVKDYLVDKLRPGDEDRALSEVISETLHKKELPPVEVTEEGVRKVVSDAVHKREDDPERRMEHQRILGKVTESEEVKRRLGGESVVTEKKYQEMYVNSPGKGVVDKLKGVVGTCFTNPAENQSSQDSSMNYEAGRAEVEQVNQGAAGERRQQESSN